MPVDYQHDRHDLGYLASDGESLPAYVNRLKSIVETQRYTYAPAHERWYTHRGNAPCWICNQMDCLDYLVGLLTDMVIEDKKHKWVCHRDTNSKDPLTYHFKPQKVL